MALSWRSTTWPCVQARSKTRSARLRSRILFDQHECVFAGLGDAGDQVDAGRFIGIDRDQLPDRDDRVEHRARAYRRAGASARARSGLTRVRPRPMNFVRSVSNDIVPIDVPRTDHQVQHPRGCLLLGPRPAGAEDRLAIAPELGLDEQVAEGRVGRVGCGRGEDHFGVAGELDRPRRSRDRLVIVIRRSSMSSSGETLISVWVSMSPSRRRNSARD